MIFEFAVASLAILAVANFLIWRHWDRLHVPVPVPARFGKRAASLVTIALVLSPWYSAASRSRDYNAHMDQLRADHPFVSMEERLPVPRGVTTANAQRLEEYETHLKGTSQYENYSKDFAELHNDHVRTFSMLPGVGQERMRIHIRKAAILPEPVPQPGVLRDEIDPSGDAMPDAKVRDLFGLHASSIDSFVNFKGFGYLKSRREVAGFMPHDFQHLPESKTYKLERLELVGLVRNLEPAVYVSEFLPRMTELDAVTTRPADGFEAEALKKLAAGEDLVATITGSKVRLLGAVRNMAVCVECHGGQRGDLLGAFSYRLAEAR